MSHTIQLKKFKKNVEEYMRGKWFKQWEGIKNRDDARQILELTANTRSKKDFDKFPGLDLEPIQDTKNHYSIKLIIIEESSLFERIIKPEKSK